MWKKLTHGILIGLAAAVFSLALWRADLLNWLEWPLWDLRVRTLAKPSASTDRIRLILLDQSSLDWGKEVQRWSWPWPRTAYAAIVDFCSRGGAKTVALDVLFTEPSVYGVEDDETLGSALDRASNSVAGVMLSATQGETTKWPNDAPLPNLKIEGLKNFLSSPTAKHLAMPRGSFPIPEVATNSGLMGNVRAAPDRDKIIRRAPLFHLFDGHLAPSLGLAAFCASRPDLPIAVGENEMLVGGVRIPLDSAGRAIVRYRGEFPTNNIVSAQAVVQSEIRLSEGGKSVLDPSYFRDCHVFFAFSAPGLLDLRATPFSPVSPGVEIHAAMLDNLLSNDFMRDAPKRMVFLSTIFFCLFAGIAGRLSEKGWHIVALFALLLPLPIAEGLVFYEKGVWMPVAVQEIAVALALVGVVTLNYAIEGRQKRFIKGAFKQYLSAELIERLTEHPDQLKLGGETRELTIFFSDVRGFTTISESLKPEPLTALLNEYLTAMSDIIMAEGGTIDKYEGDAIIAFWNAPLDLDRHADRGVRAALLCQKKLAEMRPLLKERYGKDIHARIGVNTGSVVVGNMGSNQRFNYTFLGDAGNLASRLEGINKQFGTFVMISEFTAGKLGDEFALRELSRVRVVGRAEPVRVCEPMFKADFAQRQETLNVFATALKAYYDGRFDEAIGAFSAISEKDPPAQAYMRKCRELAAKPPAVWDGVWEMTEK